MKVFNRWIAKVTDDIATKLVALSEKPLTDSTYLELCFTLQKLTRMYTSISNENLGNRIESLIKTCKQLANGENINSGWLNDQRYASHFSLTRTKTKKNVNPANVPRPKKVVKKIKAPDTFEKRIRCNMNPETNNRNELQKMIMRLHTNSANGGIGNYIDSLSGDDLLTAVSYKDAYGNNTIHIMALAAQNLIMDKILARLDAMNPEFVLAHINSPNDSDETPMTIAIKKGGYWKVMRVLQKYGGQIPSGRKEALQQFAINNGFSLTAKELSGCIENIETVSKDQTAEEIDFYFQTAMEKQVAIDANS
jgi:hypothetical protein